MSTDSFHTKFPFCKWSKNSENSPWKFKSKWVIIVANLEIQFGEIDTHRRYKTVQNGEIWENVSIQEKI